MKSRYRLLILLAFLCCIPIAEVFAQTSVQQIERVSPEFTTHDRLMLLEVGLSKAEVINRLEIYPYELLFNTAENCEVHIYKIASTRRSHFRLEDKDGTRDQLDKGNPYYTDIDDVYIYFREGAFEAFVLKSVEKEIYSLIAFDNQLQKACASGNENISESTHYSSIPVDTTSSTVVNEVEPILGCMDPTSLNYNPDAEVDDGSCEYCDCGYEAASLTAKESLQSCPPCLPSEDLWQFWLADHRCDMIRLWIEKYPPMIEKVPVNYFDSEACRPDSVNENCDWCELINDKKVSISTIELKNK